MSNELSTSTSDVPASASVGTVFRPGTGTAVFWIAAGFIAWVVSFLLYLEYVGQLTDAPPLVSCDINPIVTCGPNLLSPAGNLLGFTNAIIGMVAFVGPILVGIGALAAPGGMRAWYWRIYAVCVLGGCALVHFFAYRSVFEFGSLCPWCMVIWFVTIPLFWSVIAWSLRAGVWGQSLRGAGAFIGRWMVLIVVLDYAVIAVAAQLRLDLLGAFF
ncbi:vitamin K epoxide reductase family protein [Microbacterium sp.]|uniref:vitamin K epoxide reductase family protein n=1 Tax=Microbacterium sp. TaxID=51671 RepID=UPI003A95C5EA